MDIKTNFLTTLKKMKNIFILNNDDYLLNNQIYFKTKLNLLRLTVKWTSRKVIGNIYIFFLIFIIIKI